MRPLQSYGKEELQDFIIESNKIEGIPHVYTDQYEHYRLFLDQRILQLPQLESLAHILEPEKGIVRSTKGMDVRVGNHVAELGGPKVRHRLDNLLLQIVNMEPHLHPLDIYRIHAEFENLHPFMDGNGRVGRALWLRLMLRQSEDRYFLQRGFLHTHYYQSLSYCDDLLTRGIK